jgi:hypothetical protein
VIAYLAGPMRGYPRYNFDAFLSAAEQLFEHGYEVLSPAQHDLDVGFDPDGPLDRFDLEAAMRWDIGAVLAAQVVVLLPGWRESEGVAVELTVARAIGTPAIELEDALRIPVLVP